MTSHLFPSVKFALEMKRLVERLRVTGYFAPDAIQAAKIDATLWFNVFVRVAIVAP